MYHASLYYNMRSQLCVTALRERESLLLVHQVPRMHTAHSTEQAVQT
jgi:hypothetical protein